MPPLSYDKHLSGTNATTLSCYSRRAPRCLWPGGIIAVSGWMALLSVIVLIGIAQAQPAFEVASVKPAKDGPNGVTGGCHGIDSKFAPNQMASAPPLGRCVIKDGRLGHMLNIAFGLGSMGLIRGGPDWVLSGADRFNVEAKAEDPTTATESQLLQMLQTMLIQRFSVKFHREDRDVPGFALEVAKNGPKIHPAKTDEIAFNFPGGKPFPGQPICLNASRYSMTALAALLTQMWNPVVDKTGLTGEYDFKLCWNDTDGPSLFSAVQEQLGLKFESQKVPVSFVIIESAQKPAEN
jgi:uncharacterized protein (TIGR03435 family)